MMFHVFAAARLFERAHRGQRLDGRFDCAAGLGYDEEARCAEVEIAQHGVHGRGIEIVRDVDIYTLLTVCLRTPARKLCQRLRAQRRTADAEDHKVGRIVEKMFGHLIDPCEIVGARGNTQQRQCAARMRVAQPGKRGFCLAEGGIKSLTGKPPFPDAIREAVVERLTIGQVGGGHSGSIQIKG